MTSTHDELAAAEALYNQGRMQESRQAFMALLNSAVRADALYGLGMIAYHGDELESAQGLFEQSIGVRRRNPDALYYLARTLLAKGATQEAVSLLGEVLSHSPSHTAALRDLAQLVGGTPRAADGTGIGPSASRPDRVGTEGRMPERGRREPLREEVAATRPPNDPQSSSAVVGIARQLSKGVGPYRGKPAALQIWTFRLETYDEQGRAGPVLGVEMRGNEITGTLESGDWVELGDPPRAGQGFRPKEIRNLTTNDFVRSRKQWFMA